MIRFKDIPKIEARYILDGFRKAFRYGSNHKKCLDRAKVVKTRLKKDGTPSMIPRVSFLCNICQKEFKQKEVQVDHIEPVVPLGTPLSDMTLEKYYIRCCKKPKIQVLCKRCHKEKSKEENMTRRSLKKNNKMSEEDKDRAYDLITAIELTSIILKNCRVDSDVILHKNAISYYKKELKKLEDKYEETNSN